MYVLTTIPFALNVLVQVHVYLLMQYESHQNLIKELGWIQCSLDYTEKYYLDYTENKAHSLGVRKTIRVLSGKLSKPA